MFTAEPTLAQLRRDPLPLLGRVAVVAGSPSEGLGAPGSGGARLPAQTLG